MIIYVNEYKEPSKKNQTVIRWNLTSNIYSKLHQHPSFNCRGTFSCLVSIVTFIVYVVFIFTNIKIINLVDPLDHSLRFGGYTVNVPKLPTYLSVSLSYVLGCSNLSEKVCSRLWFVDLWALQAYSRHQMWKGRWPMVVIMSLSSLRKHTPTFQRWEGKNTRKKIPFHMGIY